MAISGVSAVNKVSEVTASEVFQFNYCEITEMLSFSDVTIQFFFFADYFLRTNAFLMWILYLV